MEPIETRNLKDGTVLSIYADENPESPRSWDNLGIMVCSHKRYDLGDKNTVPWDSLNDWDEVKQYLIKEEGAVVILPLYMLDHSGITVATHPFGGTYGYWDSGQIGFIYTTEKKLKEYGVTEEQAAQNLQAEVKTYDQYVTGDVYYYTVTKTSTCPHCKETKTEVVDSCGGFFGSDIEENGIIDHIGKENLIA